jgi:hypothetical protein
MRIAKGFVVVMILADVVHAQGNTPSQNTDPMATLTSEVRLLRLAVEKSAQLQTQIQALGVYLSAQQSRLVGLSGRLDTVRTELDRIGLGVRNVASGVTAEASRTPATMAERDQQEKRLASMKHELKLMSDHEAQVRSREAAIAAELQTELARWTDLTSRLEQLIKQ